ncbi:Uncharacterized protein TCM_001399 [Theobroma cacao]|uniref:Uncharacterized protein n=1 Tax=Theobroma cacao TaxID=3641 RepID=A0A061DR64_THECC|nr:Uncharacterized protein TCM_001399 [Theobroma cacao]
MHCTALQCKCKCTIASVDNFTNPKNYNIEVDGRWDGLIRKFDMLTAGYRSKKEPDDCYGVNASVFVFFLLLFPSRKLFQHSGSRVKAKIISSYYAPAKTCLSLSLAIGFWVKVNSNTLARYPIDLQLLEEKGYQPIEGGAHGNLRFSVKLRPLGL